MFERLKDSLNFKKKFDDFKQDTSDRVEQAKEDFVENRGSGDEESNPKLFLLFSVLFILGIVMKVIM